MRRVFALTMFLCVMYFLGGGLASVSGLFALTRPAITKSVRGPERTSSDSKE